MLDLLPSRVCPEMATISLNTGSIKTLSGKTITSSDAYFGEVTLLNLVALFNTLNNNMLVSMPITAGTWRVVVIWVKKINNIHKDGEWCSGQEQVKLLAQYSSSS